VTVIVRCFVTVFGVLTSLFSTFLIFALLPPRQGLPGRPQNPAPSGSAVSVGVEDVADVAIKVEAVVDGNKSTLGSGVVVEGGDMLTLGSGVVAVVGDMLTLGNVMVVVIPDQPMLLAPKYIIEVEVTYRDSA
jgi:hypothetical protein